MKKLFGKPITLITLCLTLFSVSAIAGADSYTIYLNNKLILKEYVSKASLTLKDLQLNQSNMNDMLIISYNHCGTIGKGRSIVIKDEQGKLLKEWKFADAEGSDAGMKIPVKDLLALEKSSGKNALNIYYYSSQLLPKGKALASIKTGSQNATSLRLQKNENFIISSISIASWIAAGFTRFYL